MSSRLAQARPAVRTALHGRMLLAGPPGSGKTRTGLIVATELAADKPILGIDTEKESMATYADDFAFEHLRWLPPYEPRELAQTLADAGDRYGCIIIDSLSHFWRGEGGTLDIAGGKFTGWKEARPAQEAMVEAIVSVPTHIILCVRAKVEYAQEQEASGKHVVRKLGMAAVQDDTLEYEVNVAIEMSMDHTATVSKTRTTVLPVGRAFRAGHAHELGTIYRDWLAGGEPLLGAAEVAALKDMFSVIPNKQQRIRTMNSFAEHFGRPDALIASRLAEAQAWIEEATAAQLPEAGATEPEVEPAADEGPA